MRRKKLKLLNNRIRETKNHGLLYTSRCTARKIETSLRHTFFNRCEICLILDFASVSLWKICKRNLTGIVRCF